MLMRASFSDTTQFDAQYTLNAGSSGTISSANANNGSDPVEYKVLGNWSADNFNSEGFGDIAETVIYQTDSLEPIDIQRVESYLALKYGITLDQTTAQDYIASDKTTKM
jgi:hypothetical protein